MNKKTKKGLSVRRLNFLMTGIVTAVSAFLLITTFITASRYGTVRENTDAYISWNQNAELLISGSDYLTEQARLFAYKGDRVYLDNYFKEVKETKQRDTALEALQEIKNTEAYEKLSAAMNESLSLMQTEYYSMRLVIGAKGYDLNDFPEEVRSVTLSEEDAGLSDDAKMLKALTILINEEYDGSKEIIRANTQKCIVELADIMESRMEESVSSLNVTLFLQQGLIIGLVVVILTLLLLTTFQVIQPLVNAIPNIRDEKPLPDSSGAYEYRYLARTYNKMYETTRETKKQLTFEANHDKLTGLFNRSGFDQFVATADLDNAAFLLIDVDDFKKINDSAGHNLGDKALILLADSMRTNFRTGDCLCRIGGDEFIAVLTRVSRSREHFKERITEKIERINEELSSHAEDGIPPFSISAGVSFGDAAEDVEEALERADEALYSVKRSGKKSVRFSE